MKKIITDLIDACEKALSVGEIRFKTCALASDAHRALSEAAVAARNFLQSEVFQEEMNKKHPPYIMSSTPITPEEAEAFNPGRPGAHVQLLSQWDATLKIVCKYSCNECGVNMVEVGVPARPADMDIIHWIEQVAGRVIGADHAMRSPKCTCRSMSQLMIPVTGAPHVGSPSVS